MGLRKEGRKEARKERGVIYCPYIGDGAEFQVGRLNDDMHCGSKAAPSWKSPGKQDRTKETLPRFHEVNKKRPLFKVR